MAFPQPFASCCWVQTSLRCGSLGASRLVLGHQAYTPPYTNSAESPPMGNNKVRLCAQGSTTPGTPPRRPLCSTAMGLFRGPWAHGRWAHTARRKADTRADSPCWGLCGFHLSKTFPWTGSSSPSCCRGLPPCQGQSTEPRAARVALPSSSGLRCWLHIKLRLSSALLVT